MPQVVALKPKMVIVIVGTNDFKSLTITQSSDYIAATCELLDANNIPSIWTNVHAYTGSAEYGVPALTPEQIAKVEALNTWMSTEIPGPTRTLVDFKTWKLAHLDLFPDSCHPSTPIGYQALAQYIWDNKGEL